MSALGIGLAGMTVSQRLIELTGHNLTNAATPGYHRRVAELALRLSGNAPTGVEIKQFRALRSDLLEEAILRNTGETQALDASLGAVKEVESMFDTGPGSIHDLLDRFFNQMQELSADPGSMSQRRVVLGTAQALSNEINNVNGQLADLQRSVTDEAKSTVDDINRLTPQIAELNGRIKQATLANEDTSDLRDQRSQLLTQLSELVDVRTLEQDAGTVAVFTAGTPLVLGVSSQPLQFTIDDKNQAIVTTKGSNVPLAIQQGKLAGLLESRNSTLPDFAERLTAFTSDVVRRIDGVHATGLGLAGPLTQASGVRAVNNVNAILSQAGLGFPPSAGVLSVSVTNLATGARTLHQIAIDPATQSLHDVAAALSTIPNLQGIADTQTKTLKIIAGPAYGFDFAGRLPTSPSTSNLSGTATPSLSGKYTGSANDTYTFSVVGSGTVGVTPGLQLEVRNSANQLTSSLNVGQGYEPGSNLPGVDGVVVALNSGTLNNGESFTVPVVANADTGGILTALGINTLFSGEPKTGFALRSDVEANPALFAASQSGLPADGANLQRMDALRSQSVLAQGTQTFEEYFDALVGDAGIQVQNLSQKLTAKQALGQSLDAHRSEVSGVDPNEELVQLLTFQKSFQASARFISVVNDTLDELFRLV